MSPRLLLVIPCFRESERLPRFLPGLCETLAAAGWPVAIQVVDDGSGETEREKLRALVEEMRYRCPLLRPLHAMPHNGGKGVAVYAGWDSTDGEEFLAFVDADGAVSAEETSRLIGLALEPENAGRAVLAVRVHGHGRRVRRTFVRAITGSVFRLLVRFFFALPVPDTQCGCKIVPAEAYSAIRGGLREFRFCFDVELLALLHRRGVPLRPVPIDWEESPGSRVRPATIREMFLSLLRLRRRLQAE